MSKCTPIKTKLYAYELTNDNGADMDFDNQEDIEDSLNEALSVDGILKENLIDIKFSTTITSNNTTRICVLVVYSLNENSWEE